MKGLSMDDNRFDDLPSLTLAVMNAQSLFQSSPRTQIVYDYYWLQIWVCNWH